MPSGHVDLRRESNLNRGKSIRVRIVVPLGMALLVSLGASIAGIHWFQSRQTNEIVRSSLDVAERLFKKAQEEEALVMSSAIDFMKRDRALQIAWRTRDRDALSQQATPLFMNLQSRSGVTHLSFIDPDGICFYRVHDPPRHGDRIRRFTFDEAAREGRPASGIELDSLGSLTLRVVHPWQIDGNRLGYIELGEQIEHISNDLSQILVAELFFIIDKSRLDRAAWVEDMRMKGRTGDWERFQEIVIIHTTMENAPSELTSTLEEVDFEPRGQVLTDRESNRIYRGGFFPLIDALGRDVGNMIVLHNITEIEASSHLLTSAMAVACVAIGGTLFMLFYFIVDQLEGSLTTAHD